MNIFGYYELKLKHRESREYAGIHLGMRKLNWIKLLRRKKVFIANANEARVVTW